MKGRKTGGRKPGSTNKTTSQIKDLLVGFIGKNIDSIQEEYNKLNAADKLKFFKDILRFVLPTQSSNDVTINNLTDAQVDELYQSVLDKISAQEEEII